jgi:hypothetical protein
MEESKIRNKELADDAATTATLIVSNAKPK